MNKIAAGGEFGGLAPGDIHGEVPRTIADLQEAFVRCHLLEAREPGGGRWPFAGDGPWHLMQRDHVDDTPALADRSTTLLETPAGQLLEVRKVDSLSPRIPLSCAEVDELATLRRWLLLVPDAAAPLASDHDRRLVWLATGRLARGDVSDGGRVPWKQVRRWLGSPRTPEALARRYRLALARTVCRLNCWPMDRAQRMAG